MNELEKRIEALEKELAVLLWLHGGEKPQNTGTKEQPDRHFDYFEHNEIK